MMIAAMSLCAVVMTGCGNKHVELAQEFGEVLCSGDHAKADAFAEKNIDKDFVEIAKNHHALKKVFAKFSGANENITKQVLWKGEEGGAKGAVVALTRGGVTLYVIVAEEKGKEAKIAWVSEDKNMVDAMIMKEFKKAN